VPIVAYSCPCGRLYDVLDGSTIKDGGEAVCPDCGASEGQEKQLGTFAFKGDFRPEHMDPVEKQMILDNRAMHERMILTGARDTGEMTVKESGPDWTRPFGNNEFARKKAIEDSKVLKT
jgi:hypothetical protein